MELSNQTVLWLYKTMLTTRYFEERLVEETSKGKTRGSIHTSVGQEAVPAGVCAHLAVSDYISSTHRGHGHAIAKGVNVNEMMAEIFGKSTGICKGKGGSVHIADFSKGMLGTIGIVGAGVPLAVGAALSSDLRQSDSVSIAFFGDGAANQGILHESMNLASIWKLPVVFVCENNQYADATPVEYATSATNISDRAAGYNMPGWTIDGMNVLAVYDAAGVAIGRARAGQGPSLLECKTYRYYGHFFGDNPLTYRLKEEQEIYREQDPILQFENDMRISYPKCFKATKRIRQEVTNSIEKAIEFAYSSPYGPISDLYDDVYVNYAGLETL